MCVEQVIFSPHTSDPIDPRQHACLFRSRTNSSKFQPRPSLDDLPLRQAIGFCLRVPAARSSKSFRKWNSTRRSSEDPRKNKKEHFAVVHSHECRQRSTTQALPWPSSWVYETPCGCCHMALTDLEESGPTGDIQTPGRLVDRAGTLLFTQACAKPVILKLWTT